MVLRLFASLLLAAQLLAPGVVLAGSEGHCSMQGDDVRSCCCENGMRGARNCAKLAARACCEMEPGVDTTATRSGATPNLGPAVVAQATAPLAMAALPRHRRVATACRGATGPPIFLRNCSLLR